MIILLSQSIKALLHPYEKQEFTKPNKLIDKNQEDLPDTCAKRVLVDNLEFF